MVNGDRGWVVWLSINSIDRATSNLWTEIPGVKAEPVVWIDAHSGPGVNRTVLQPVVVDERVHVHVSNLLWPRLHVRRGYRKYFVENKSYMQLYSVDYLNKDFFSPINCMSIYTFLSRPPGAGMTTIHVIPTASSIYRLYYMWLLLNVKDEYACIHTMSYMAIIYISNAAINQISIKIFDINL